MALNSGIQTNQILTNNDEVCIPRLSSILLAVLGLLRSQGLENKSEDIKFPKNPKMMLMVVPCLCVDNHSGTKLKDQ